MAIDWCCPAMEYHATTVCDLHDRFACPDVVMHRYVNSDGQVWFGIPIHDGGTSAIAVDFCPWCATPLSSAVLPSAAD